MVAFLRPGLYPELIEERVRLSVLEQKCLFIQYVLPSRQKIIPKFHVQLKLSIFLNVLFSVSLLLKQNSSFQILESISQFITLQRTMKKWKHTLI
jgi:hypothetical protein